MWVISVSFLKERSFAHSTEGKSRYLVCDIWDNYSLGTSAHHSLSFKINKYKLWKEARNVKSWPIHKAGKLMSRTRFKVFTKIQGQSCPNLYLCCTPPWLAAAEAWIWVWHISPRGRIICGESLFPSIYTISAWFTLVQEKESSAPHFASLFNPQMGEQK